MTEAVFLSASVPNSRGDRLFARADAVAITAAVTALLHVTLGRRLLVWGGHPTITSMLSVAAEYLGVDYADWVRLYQSDIFAGEFPDDNDLFQNVTYTEKVPNDRDASLTLMRRRMFAEVDLTAAVFVGGMGGVVEEFELFRQARPTGKVVPVASTGGAARQLVRRMRGLSSERANALRRELDYVALFHDELAVPVRERRYERRSDQPPVLADRLEPQVSQAGRGTQAPVPQADPEPKPTLL